ncbi:transposable element Tcb1 transposase [Trichonephila clavipes]|uniref:Transposable element Tcb1 transposase n=1 Tax=Trichonephila clavipes TaxID=2585209 RepID=A0A8X6W0H1_TRICX|nr:transposable element Tcb1 transposase [Trichonephila clavipes]
MTSQWYVDNIMQTNVLPLMQRLPEDIFQQANAWLYSTRILQNCLRHINTLLWLSRSPDLSPIVPICNHFEWQVGQPTGLVKLVAHLQQLWIEMPQDIIRNFHASIPSRAASCIRVRRDPTEY